MHVVDDDASFRTAIERRLKKAGYEVATYPSAQHLLDRLPSEIERGCILLDVRIPELSGPELQGRLSELGSTLPYAWRCLWQRCAIVLVGQRVGTVRHFE
jgi:FixJ family two-component response regulator